MGFMYRGSGVRVFRVWGSGSLLNVKYLIKDIQRLT